jgi:hypothetical protein
VENHNVYKAENKTFHQNEPIKERTQVSVAAKATAKTETE